MLVSRKVHLGRGGRLAAKTLGFPRDLAISGVLGFLGFGNMAKAIAKGLIQAGAIPPDQLLAFDLKTENATQVEEIGGLTAESAAALAEGSQTLLLATKPQDMKVALDSIASHLSADSLVISIAAGISISYIQDMLGTDCRVTRVMPNTPALVGAGAAGIALSPSCTEEDAGVAEAIFESVGITERLPESALDAVTALSASGPAYFFAFVEACVKAGVGLGLPEDQATRLAAQTLYGAGLLLKESGESAGTLRERVTSKGGTTEAALACFEQRDLDGVVRAAIEAAAARSEELGK